MCAARDPWDEVDYEAASWDNEEPIDDKPAIFKCGVSIKTYDVFDGGLRYYTPIKRYKNGKIKFHVTGYAPDGKVDHFEEFTIEKDDLTGYEKVLLVTIHDTPIYLYAKNENAGGTNL